MNDKAWLVVFATDDRYPCEIVIYCPTKDGVKPILKKHMQGKPYKIKRITEWSAFHEG